MDYLIFQKINQFAGKWASLDKSGVFFAENLGYVLLLLLLLFLVKDLKKYWPMAFQALLAAILARFGITELIRFFWERQRPFVENKVNLLLSHDITGSFPSGHAAFFFGLSAVVYFYNKKAGVFFLFASFLISISRVFAGVHWPSDILMGAVVGVFSGWLIFAIYRAKRDGQRR
ncbi:MAG: phosphatase PAP2 family protein [bacterium]|nr:phosphatase PAP2 family protein [bacterium]